MNTTDKINKFISENGGNTRDALNIALARLEASEKEKEYWKEEANKNKPDIFPWPHGKDLIIKNSNSKKLKEFDVWYKPCENCGYDTAKSVKPKKGNKKCWKCGDTVYRDYSDRALKKVF